MANLLTTNLLQARDLDEQSIESLVGVLYGCCFDCLRHNGDVADLNRADGRCRGRLSDTFVGSRRGLLLSTLLLLLLELLPLLEGNPVGGERCPPAAVVVSFGGAAHHPGELLLLRLTMSFAPGRAGCCRIAGTAVGVVLLLCEVIANKAS